VSDSTSRPRWSDRKADAVAVLVIFTAAVLFALYFVSASA
jgi:hypothetical protein